MVIYIGHLLSLCIYLAIILTCIGNLIAFKTAYLTKHHNILLCGFTLSLLAQSSLFLYLQIDWINMDYNEAVGDVTAFLWLAFDYFNGIALLCSALAVNVYIKLKLPSAYDDVERRTYRRRGEDQP